MPAVVFSALARARRALIRIRLPLVIVGIGLSTLLQSSLGSLFLIMPYRLKIVPYEYARQPVMPLRDVCS